jgi:hypothetical protein
VQCSLSDDRVLQLRPGIRKLCGACREFFVDREPGVVLDE